MPEVDPKLSSVGEIEDVDISGRQYAWSAYGVWIVLLVVFAVGLTIVSYTYNHGDMRFGVYAFVLPVMLYGYAKNKVGHLFMQQFAEEHELTYASTQKDLSDISSKYLDFGRNRSLSDILTGTYNSKPIRLYNFSTTVGQGKSSHTLTFTVFETTYQGEVTDVVLESVGSARQANNFISPFPELKSISLEGDFNKYYAVYAPENADIEAREILTPDVMLELEYYASLYSFEFVAGKLYIAALKEVKKKSELEAMYDFSEKLTTRLIPISQSQANKT